MRSRDVSQSVFLGSLSVVFSEQEDSGCEEGLEVPSSFAKALSLRKLMN